MLEDFSYDLVKAVIALFVIVDPIGNVPIFISLTENMRKDERKSAFHTATWVALALLLAFALAGQQVLNVFGISLHSFMIAGGLLLLVLAINILLFGGWKEKEKVVSPKSVGAVPIACPLLVGPGAITTTILILQTSGIVVTLIAVVIIFALIWGILRLIEPIYKVLGETGAAVIARIMAIFIAAIAVGFVIDGITYYIRP